MSTLGKTLLLGSTAYFSLVKQNGGIYDRKILVILNVSIISSTRQASLSYLW
jgi:hypothetical protein